MKRKGDQIIGLSSETKPIAGTRAGIDFLETDTGKVFIFDGSKWLPTWAKIGPTGKRGATGATGHAGPTGPTGPTGPSAI